MVYSRIFETQKVGRVEIESFVHVCRRNRQVMVENLAQLHSNFQSGPSR